MVVDDNFHGESFVHRQAHGKGEIGGWGPEAHLTFFSSKSLTMTSLPVSLAGFDV